MTYDPDGEHSPSLPSVGGHLQTPGGLPQSAVASHHLPPIGFPIRVVKPLFSDRHLGASGIIQSYFEVETYAGDDLYKSHGPLLWVWLVFSAGKLRTYFRLRELAPLTDAAALVILRENLKRPEDWDHMWGVDWWKAGAGKRSKSYAEYVPKDEAIPPVPAPAPPARSAPAPMSSVPPKPASATPKAPATPPKPPVAKPPKPSRAKRSDVPTLF
jgi:hypothetical protein